MPTYTCYPTAGTSVDGEVSLTAQAISWSSLRSTSSGNGKYDTLTSASAGFFSEIATNLWAGLERVVLVFDTSAIPTGVTIASATVSLYGKSVINSAEYTTKFDIYTSNPSSNSSLHLGDYGTFGSTSQTTGALNLASINTSGYNDWTLSATGIANIVPAGLTKFGVREKVYDANGATPTWTSAADFEFEFFTSDYGISRAPKLVVVTAGTTYNDTPSGGLVHGGSVVVTRSLDITRSGGIALGGSATSVKGTSVTSTPSGGIVLGGSNVSDRAFAATPSGGIRLGGPVAQIGPVTLTVRLMSGGTQIATWSHVLTGNQARVSWARMQMPLSVDLTPHGGLVLGGTNTVTLTRALTQSGGMVLNGSCTSVVVISTVYNDAPTGGIIMGGFRPPPILIWNQYPGWNEALWGGGAVPLAGMILGGSLITSFAAPAVPTGGIVLDGNCLSIGGNDHLVIGARALVSVAGRPGAITIVAPELKVITGARALVRVSAPTDWECGVRILDAEDSDSQEIEPEDSLEEEPANPFPSGDGELVLVNSGGNGLDLSRSDDLTLDPDRSSCA